ncbi:exported hypothetical protein [Candidatus Sulfotelmatomonas gaucii]|uniref:Uncharacterized protein n=1 Tax=Candidatus Sulfuritelmatomonas gaucii TaxID=2043161 RepID=A0A2N9L7Z9_9BACT|nr:exported hypothetical protein [Candidatus Sulfotelmatomonas gaucii]
MQTSKRKPMLGTSARGNPSRAHASVTGGGMTNLPTASKSRKSTAMDERTRPVHNLPRELARGRANDVVASAGEPAKDDEGSVEGVNDMNNLRGDEFRVEVFTRVERGRRLRRVLRRNHQLRQTF